MDFVIGTTAIIAIVLSIINLRLIRIHSSPKPFIKLEYVHVGSHIPIKVIGKKTLEMTTSNANTEQDLSPTVGLINIGKGIAVNINVYANANTKSGESIDVRLEGPSVLIDTAYVKDGKVIGKYDCEKKDVLLSEIMQVYINYNSDSGYKRETVWEYDNSNGNGSINLLKSN